MYLISGALLLFIDRCVWRLITLVISFFFYWLRNANNEITDRAANGFHVPLDHSQFTKLLISCWAIWSARRRAIHEGEFQSPLSTLGFINSYLNELGEVSMVARPVGGRCVTGPSGWTPPPPGVVKIHVDGAVARAGLGAVSAFYFIMVHILGCYPA